MEKIYEICVACRSKVNFELTKQNGMLKQYFLNLGNFDYFYEKPQPTTSNIHQATNSASFGLRVHTINTYSSSLQAKLNFFLFVLSYLIIFILASLILTYNEYNYLIVNGELFIIFLFNVFGSSFFERHGTFAIFIYMFI